MKDKAVQWNGDPIPLMRQLLQARRSDEALQLCIELLERRSYAQAAATLPLLLAEQPDNGAAYSGYGDALSALQRWPEAERAYRKALSLGFVSTEVFINLGIVLRLQGKLELSVECCRRAITLNPKLASGHVNLGAALARALRPSEAVESFRQALLLSPDRMDAAVHLAVALTALGRFDEAEELLTQLLARPPDHHEVLAALSRLRRLQRRYPEALELLDRCLALQPDNADYHFWRGQCLLVQGDYERGWPEFEWRFRSRQRPRPFRKPPWDGSPFVGKTLLVHAEQGLGDTIQFARLLPWVRQRGGKVMFECQPEVLPLLQETSLCDLLLARPADGALPDCDFDAQIHLVSLPGLLQITAATIPGQTPYLTAPSAKAQAWQKRLAGDSACKVGIVWAGNPGHPRDLYRSLPLSAFVPLAQVAGLSLYSLQKGAAASQLAETALPIADLTPDLHDLSDTAAAIMNLDLVISVDTCVTHLAGALGRPVWTLLPFDADWRWLSESTDTPWYPTMRLFRQPRFNDWAAVVSAVCVELTQLRIVSCPRIGCSTDRCNV
jgi:Flp pilus assembly protein TadD